MSLSKNSTQATGGHLYRIWHRPDGSYCIARFVNGTVQKWGDYRSKKKAIAELRLANAPTVAASEIWERMK